MIGLRRLPASKWWREHAVEHHRKGRNDINVELGALSPLFTASPMLMLAVVLGWPWVATVLTTCILYSALWSSLHAAYHGKNDGWVTRLAIYARWKEHHLRHHEYPNRNFGTVFIFTDRIFGTKHLQSSSSAA